MANTTSVVSRMKIIHPDLGYEGGIDVHTYVRNIYDQFGDNINSRVFAINDFAIGATLTLDHNLGSSMSHNRFMVYSGTFDSMTALTGASTPSLDDFEIISTPGFTDSRCDITNNSGSLQDIVVVIYQDSISPNPILMKTQTVPDSAPTGYYNLYPKSDGKFYRKGADGVESVVGGGLTPVKVVYTGVANTVKDGTNYLVDTTGGIIDFTVTAGNSGLLQFGIKNDGSDFATNKARITCDTATIFIPDLGTVGVGEYLNIDAPVDALLFDWDGTRWVVSTSGVKDLAYFNGSRQIISSSTTAMIKDILHVDTSAEVKTITLPLAPVAGDWVTVADAKGSFATYPCTLGRNGKNINGSATDFDCDISGKSYTAVFIDEAYGWSIYF